jgi:[acyl-carrier-protein] S-malonyltransferase
MGKALAEASPAARALLVQADQVLGLPLGRIMAEGPEAELTRTDISQPAILVHSCMALAAVREKKCAITFAATAGLSLGEYSALVAAEAISFADAVRLVRLRGEAMQAAATAVASGMVALIGPDEATAQKLCDACAEGEILQVANLNSPGQVVISGAKAACERAAAKAKEFGIRRAVPLPVAGAFHSALMAPAADRLQAALAAATFRDPKVPVYANVTAAPVTRAADIPGLLVRQLTSPVRWAASVQAMFANGMTDYLELGPQKQLSGMIGKTLPPDSGVTCRNIDGTLELAAF